MKRHPQPACSRGRTPRRAALTLPLLAYALLAGITVTTASLQAQTPQPDVVQELTKQVPADFPRFTMTGQEQQADLLTHYLWYHFQHRPGINLTLFNKEYLLTADIWMGNAAKGQPSRTIQEIHRDLLLGMQMDDEGYVFTHQHFSHAHDHGWPFPLWTQADKHPAATKGKTVGWHFQKLEEVPGWAGDGLRYGQLKQYVGTQAADAFELHHLKSLGIIDKRWRLQATGPSPTLLTPAGVEIDAFQAPYLQLRWKRTGQPTTHTLPYIEWLREGDEAFTPDRRVYFHPEKTPLSSDCYHSIMAMYRHPQWQGTIKRIRLNLAPGESQVEFDIDSFFAVYDTRHTINNPIFILASARYFSWTGDIDFLRRNINRMRLALRYQQTVMGGLEHNHIRVPWPGHDGLAGFRRESNGSKTILGGHGIGNNYWDLMPFGWDDFYATYQYYAATTTLATLEQAIAERPGWQIPLGALRLDPQTLRNHAAQVKQHANDLFWNDQAGRFIASIDSQGQRHDYGYTFVNLDAIWYSIASDQHAQAIMDWLTGRRLVEGDTSTGADIYHWRFGPRATTKRNVAWYGQGWYNPEDIPWGGQVQDGGAVLGFTFYDLMARVKVLGPDNAYERLQEILAWEKEVHSAGGYRAYYKAGKHEASLQGCGTAGGLGIDCEFYESSLLPSVVVYGFMGLDAAAFDRLTIQPCLPAACPRMSVENLLYHSVLMDVQVSQKQIVVTIKQEPLDAIRIELPGNWKLQETEHTGSDFTLRDKKVYRWEKL